MKRQQKKERVEESEAKFRFKQDYEDLDFWFRRTSDVTKLGAAILTFNNESLNEKFSERNHLLFKHDVADRVL